MHEALRQGRRALPGCLPNPPIGCVLVKNDSIIAQGYTNPPGEPHAEAMALSQLQGDLDGVSVFVTLEPCSFHGRTPSCAKSLAERHVEHVYVGLIDPHPRNCGAGLALLRDAGIGVSVGLLATEIEREIGAYLLASDAVRPCV